MALALFLVLVGCGPSSPGHECTACGDNSCVDIETDVDHCGECDNACNGNQVCIGGECTIDPGEMCDQGATESCYSGPGTTEGVGPCHGGTRECGSNGYWGPCEGEVTPGQDVCGNGADENCDGTADNETDQDGDGYTNCGGDCCDSTNEGCASPERVNPGAFEAPDNMLDDDCDGIVDNVSTATCDSGLPSNSADAMDYARAIDLCQTSTGTGSWGVVSARFLKADGTGAPLAEQRAIRPAWGQTSVQLGDQMAVISTANAATPSQTMPDYAPFQSTDHGASSNLPIDFQNLPNAPGCPAPIDSAAYDPVLLELKIKVPTNAQSFSMRTNFMSAEFPEWVCTEYNDFFVVLLDSTWAGDPPNPTDKNLAFYQNANNQRYPVGVNLASGDTGLFTVCQNGEYGCSGTSGGNINTCASSTELTGTGFDTADFGCSGADQVGGGTGWLTTSGNVNPGEQITLRIALWDTSDGVYDSAALIDAFTWSLNPSDPGTVIDVD